MILFIYWISAGFVLFVLPNDLAPGLFIKALVSFAVGGVILPIRILMKLAA